jgi:V/A-type H+-transporting ATPase subunit G/H
MSLEAIDAISAAEDNAKKAKLEAASAAKKMIAEAETQGRQRVEDAKQKARAELDEASRIAREKARSEAVELARNTENRKAAMLVKAESRAGQAIQLVVERIVNG